MNTFTEVGREINNLESEIRMIKSNSYQKADTYKVDELSSRISRLESQFTDLQNQFSNFLNEFHRTNE